MEALACLPLGLLFYGRQLWWLVPQLDGFPPLPILLRATQNWLGADLYASFLSFYFIAPGRRSLWRWGRSERRSASRGRGRDGHWEIFATGKYRYNRQPQSINKRGFYNEKILR